MIRHVERTSRLVASVLTSVGICVALTCWWFGKPGPAVQFDKPPAASNVVLGDAVPGPMGWSPESRDALSEWTAQQAAFQLVSRDTGEPVSQDNSKSNVRLWELKRLVVSDAPPNGPQLTGDCTSWSSAHAIEETQASQVFNRGGQWKRVFPPWLYGAGRVWVWRKQISGPMPSAGCSVAAVAKAAQDYGVLSWEDAEAAGYKYSGQLADQWGQSGPPTKLKDIAAKHKLGTVAPLRTAAELRDAVCNGYGTAFGSDFTGGKFRTVDNRIVCDNITPQIGRNAPGVWHHALCCDGYDGTAPNGPWYHIQNSWYPTSHPTPIDGSPACGFWVAESTIEYIVQQNDAFAFSDFEGFVERRDELDLFNVGVIQPPLSRQFAGTRKTQVAP